MLKISLNQTLKKRKKANQGRLIKLFLVHYHESVLDWQFLITYIFFVFLKFAACYIMGQWGEFRVKNATVDLNILFWLLFFLLLFFIRKLGFCHFCFFFWWSTNFHDRIFINQSKTGITDKKLSVELYDDHSLVHQ